MNKTWADFLTTKNTCASNLDLQFNQPCPQSNYITAMTDLGIIKVSGKDAAQFLQGQLTCNIHELTESTSFFTAFCNVKGRVISTFLLLKTADAFLLILPYELLNTVQKKLQFYVLRSKVQLSNQTNELVVIGVIAQNHFLPELPDTNFAVSNTTKIWIKFSAQCGRYLIISTINRAITLWKQLLHKYDFISSHLNLWRFQDISAGIPWLTSASSEKYIPQMLNLDKLGGISFNKGCYTGQEPISRVYHLGKIKRALFLAECAKEAKIDNDTGIILNTSNQVLGKILSKQANNFKHKMLVVLSTTDAKLKSLILNNQKQDRINIIDFC